MRINFRMKIGLFTLFFMFSKTQRLNGISSKLRNGLHVMLFDIENCGLEECEKELLLIQEKYQLSDIFITSDTDKSFRGWCFTQVTFKQYLHILSDNILFHLDYNFLFWTVQRGKATLRTSNKLGRKQQDIIATLQSYIEPIPEEFEEVIYDTGNEKRGINILLG